ncbi:MAG TPA: hypothetical protein P5337_03350 [Aestuariivirga sp.]|nr:hypothetical protein [Aestuariivirga sp.]
MSRVEAQSAGARQVEVIAKWQELGDGHSGHQINLVGALGEVLDVEE